MKFLLEVQILRLFSLYTCGDVYMCVRGVLTFLMFIEGRRYPGVTSNCEGWVVACRLGDV